MAVYMKVLQVGFPGTTREQLTRFGQERIPTGFQVLLVLPITEAAHGLAYGEAS